jgi:hypothetical protein
MQTNQRYIQAYQRVRNLEQAMSARLRTQILVPYFGGCGCRLHNCLINYETGRYESAVNGKSHKDLAHLARQYNHEQRRIWDITGRLSDSFARKF